MKEKLTALISVFNKEGLVDFAKKLAELGISIIASGGTAKAIAAAGIPVRDVSNLVGGEAILGHRVVTLSREVHAGLLARDLEEDIRELESKDIPRIDIVCVDMYPLKDAIKKAGDDLDQVIEMTDIGGPTMLRSGAKGQRVVLCDAEDRENFIRLYNSGGITWEYVNWQGAKAEGVVADYVLASARYRSGGLIDGFIGTSVLPCKYGENAWQTPAALHTLATDDPLALDKFQLVAGTAPSFNNLCDLERLLQTVTHIAAAFDLNRGSDPNIAVAAKHGNPCGAAFGQNTYDPLNGMVIGDPDAILGGMVMLNFPVGTEEAEFLMTHEMTKGKRRLLDGIFAPSVTEQAVEFLKRKGDKCRIMVNPALAHLGAASLDTAPRFRQVRGGFLKQPNYTYIMNLRDPNLCKYGQATDFQEDMMLFLWAIGSTSNSNTIALGKNRYLIADAVGQQSRVVACRLAKLRASNAGHDTMDAIAYSDSFFPFDDGPRYLNQTGINVIYTSSGSVNDQHVIDYCQKNNIILYMIPDAKGRGFYGH